MTSNFIFDKDAYRPNYVVHGGDWRGGIQAAVLPRPPTKEPQPHPRVTPSARRSGRAPEKHGFASAVVAPTRSRAGRPRTAFAPSMAVHPSPALGRLSM